MKIGATKYARLPEHLKALFVKLPNEVLAGFPQSDSKGGGGKPKSGFWGNAGEGKDAKHGDSGSAARFFYCAKASTRERNAGCEALPAKEASEVTGRLPGSPGLVMDGGKANPYAGITGASRRNVHPTVKPLDLCRYLATLILPPADRPHGPRKLLVPFSGSGSEMIGSLLAGWDDVTGIEREAEYVEIAKARLAYWTTPKMEMASTQQLSMFAHLGVSQ